MKNGPYELIVAPSNYPGMKYRGRYAYEHIVIWWKENNVMPSAGMEIHHKNGNHRDNRPSNLQLVTSKEHRMIHGKISREKSLISAICSQCGVCFKRQGNQYRSAKKNNKTGKMYCNHKCQHNSMKK